MSKIYYSLLLSVIITLNVNSQEIFADYFDINWGAIEGTEVLGKFNLKRNKDYKKTPVPSTFNFSMISDPSNSFVVETQFDPKGRIFGVLKVKSGVTLPTKNIDYKLSVALNDGDKHLKTTNIRIHVKDKTLWSQLRENYLPFTTNITKLYGRFKYTDTELSNTIADLIANNGKFKFSKMYGAHPSDYFMQKKTKKMTTDQREKARAKGIEGDWIKVIKHIGGLGYAYAHSKEFGVKSNNPEKLARLKKAIYLSTYQLVSNIETDGTELLIDGEPAGPYLGDGIATLDKYGLLSHEIATHQWELTDALASPLAHIMPSLLADKAAGDQLANDLFHELRDYFQLFFAEVESRRLMDRKDGRWREIQDDKHSNGAWSDANIGHRYRCLMLMPIVFADYNQPITYVPYWYDDFFNGTKYEGKTYAKKFSPRGVISDLRALSKLFAVPTFEYAQSGFNPDGSISHHCDHASDVAMQDYGFHWLINTLVEAKYWNNTPMPVDDESVQFIVDRYNKTYTNIIYKNNFDFTLVGRSHLANTQKFIETELYSDGTDLLELIPENTPVVGVHKMSRFLNDIENKTHVRDTSMAFWNADYVLHRKESEKDKYYFSVKNKSTRTIGAEDFSEIRKSWHFGSGVFQLKITGNEYEQIKLNKWDHHTVPGVTEEWRTDPLPTGHSAASGPGLNEFSGQLANGNIAMAGYHHKPSDSYTSAEAYKSYYMINNIGTALGTDVKRAKKGQGKSIVTTVDQNYFDSPITYFDGEKVQTLYPEDSHDIRFQSNKNTWVHYADKGYFILPKNGQSIVIKTNNHVNVTNPLDSTYIKHYTGHYYLPSPKFGTAIIAIDHGVNPSFEKGDQYHYAMVANVTANSIKSALKNYEKSYITKIKEGYYHALEFNNKLTQLTFFKAAKAALENNKWIATNLPALIMSCKNKNNIELSVCNPLHTLSAKELVITTNIRLKEGTYNYSLKGINPQPGEHFKVTSNGKITTITIQLPDSSDADRYNNQQMMYSGSPLVVRIPFL